MCRGFKSLLRYQLQYHGFKIAGFQRFLALAGYRDDPCKVTVQINLSYAGKWVTGFERAAYRGG